MLKYIFAVSINIFLCHFTISTLHWMFNTAASSQKCFSIICVFTKCTHIEWHEGWWYLCAIHEVLHFKAPPPTHKYFHLCFSDFVFIRFFQLEWLQNQHIHITIFHGRLYFWYFTIFEHFLCSSLRLDSSGLMMMTMMWTASNEAPCLSQGLLRNEAIFWWFVIFLSDFTPSYQAVDSKTLNLGRMCLNFPNNTQTAPLKGFPRAAMNLVFTRGFRDLKQTSRLRRTFVPLYH